jgi:hypothetical protein
MALQQIRRRFRPSSIETSSVLDKVKTAMKWGRAIGQNDKGTYVISRDLAQANSPKNSTGDKVYLTDHGLRLVKSLFILIMLDAQYHSN